MRQRWDDLLFLHWEIDPALIQATLPEGLTVDLHEGKAYIAIVPFKMCAVRPVGLFPVPWISNFLESNVRTYVHDESGTPGVWFYSLDTDRWLAHWIAKTFFSLPYVWSKMTESSLRYTVTREGESTASYDFHSGANTRNAAAGTLEFFLLERYLLYSYSASRKQLYRGRVHHHPYKIANVSNLTFDPAPIAWNGFPAPPEDPVHACFSPGVSVEVFPIQKLSS